MTNPIILDIALCKGRHEIPQATDGAIFDYEINPLDIEGMSKTVAEKLENALMVNLYVTGLSVALVEVIKYCYENNVSLTLWHFDRETGTYYSQRTVKALSICPYCHTPIPHGANYCPGCANQ